MKSLILNLLLGVLFLNSVFSQENKTDLSFVVSGKVINPENLEGIAYAHIKLDETYWGVICDSLGFFHLRVHPDQKLKISALGFREQIVEIVPPSVENEIFQEVYMERESYLLEQVNVYSLGTWIDFKENFVKEKLPVEENIADRFDFGNLKLVQAEANSLRRQGFGLNLADGIGLIKSIGKKRRDNKKSDELTDWQLRILQSKYNKDVIAELTHETGYRLDVLMQYINSKSDFTHQTSELYIGVRIKQLYRDFLQENPQLEENLSYTDSVGTIYNPLRP